jgi:hypothetical protein
LVSRLETVIMIRSAPQKLDFKKKSYERATPRLKTIETNPGVSAMLRDAMRSDDIAINN